MRKLLIGTTLGLIVACLDIIPMVLKDVSWIRISTPFLFWIVAGFMISAVQLKVNPIVKGIIVSLLMLLPQVFPLANETPSHLNTILILSIFLGAFLGWSIEWADKKFGTSKLEQNT